MHLSEDDRSNSRFCKLVARWSEITSCVLSRLEWLVRGKSKWRVALPETANELCIVARAAGARNDDIYLGQRATEAGIRSLSDTGKLASYKVLHFATHGALAGELTGSAEPGLILSPPSIATPEDDGYLSASEVAGLKLDADWVILSACNTAGGETKNAEGCCHIKSD